MQSSTIQSSTGGPRGAIWTRLGGTARGGGGEGSAYFLNVHHIYMLNADHKVLSVDEEFYV